MAVSEKQRVAIWSLFASGVLTLAKLVAGLATGSLGILSEAVHSLLDFAATIVTVLAVGVSDRPPDDTHHFGHAKFESVSALTATGLLFATTAWIVYEAVSRLVTGEIHVEVTWWAVAIIVGSILIDWNRGRVLSRVARKTASEALAADALHFSSDMWSSCAVLIGLGAVYLGYGWADPVAALVVAIFVAIAGYRLGKRTLDTLLDAAPKGVASAIGQLADETPGVLALQRLRIRPAGATLFVDADIAVRRTLPLDEAAEIKQHLADAVKRQYPNADISVTAHPVALDDETVFDRVMLIAGRRGLAVHHLTVQALKDRLSVSFDLELDGRMALKEAHEIATGLETAIREELGEDVEVESHIEPMHTASLDGANADDTQRKRIEATLKSLADRDELLTGIHNVRARENEHGLFVTFHCRVRGAESVEAVHEAVDALEAKLKKRLPEVRRVIAHAEPLDRPSRTLH
ncbi:MAG: cation-efflux pump [Parvibaculaceae bacterium]